MLVSSYGLIFLFILSASLMSLVVGFMFFLESSIMLVVWLLLSLETGGLLMQLFLIEYL